MLSALLQETVNIQSHSSKSYSQVMGYNHYKVYLSYSNIIEKYPSYNKVLPITRPFFTVSLTIFFLYLLEV